MAFTYSSQAHRNNSTLYTAPTTYGTMTLSNDKITWDKGSSTYYASGDQSYIIVPTSNTGGTLYLYWRGWLHTGTTAYTTSVLGTGASSDYLYGYNNYWAWYYKNGSNTWTNLGNIYTGTSNTTNSGLGGNLYLKGSSYNMWQYLAQASITWADGATTVPYYRGSGTGSYVSEYFGWAATSSSSPAYYTIPHNTISYNINGGNSTTPSSVIKYKGITRTFTTAAAATHANATSTVTYTITYNYNGSGASNTTDTSTAKKTTTYTFNGWHQNSASSSTVYSASTSVTYSTEADMVLYAGWTTSTTTGTFSSVTLPTATRTGYVHLGWSTSSSATTASYAPGASYTPTKSITLYAVWAPLAYVNVSGTWKQGIVWVNVNGTWKKGVVWVNVNGTWKTL